MRVRGVLEYAGVERIGITCHCLRMFIHFDVGIGVESHALGRERYRGRCERSSLVLRQVAGTNKLELLKWAREVKHCEWDE